MTISFLATFINILFQVLSWAIIIRVLLTWFPNIDPDNPLVQILRSITDPVLEPARRIVPSIGMIDISPIVVLIVLEVVRQVLISALYSLG
ncbi:MAG: YggT family protein [Anaerolineae bacterium]|nr:YggT family protein [Anaerolineae bacterium]